MGRKKWTKPYTRCRWIQVGPSLYMDEFGDPAEPPYVRYRLSSVEGEGDDGPFVRYLGAARGGKEGTMRTTKKGTAKKETTKKAGATKRGGGATGTVVHANDNTFGKLVRAADLPVLVDFSASWCGPCQRLGEVLPAIAKKFAGKVKVVKVDVDRSPKAATRYVEDGVPTLVVFRDGEPVAVDCGFGSRRETEKWLEAALKRAKKPGPTKPCRARFYCCG